jgi:di/tricarboxylate transporter
MDVWIVSAILMVALVLLITEKLPVDLTAIGILVSLIFTRILTPLEAIAGFASPAVIAVGAMFLVSPESDCLFTRQPETGPAGYSLNCWPCLSIY